MACSWGWIRTKNGYLMFKNRDRRKSEHLKTNYLVTKKGMISFEDKHFKGSWFGLNKYIGVMHSWGPYRKVPEGYQCPNENFHINKIVLEKAKSVKDAVALYKKIFSKEKIGKSYNVLICDKKKAIVIEFALDKVKQKTFTNSVFRTNTFLFLKKFNDEKHIFERADERLAIVKKSSKKLKDPDTIMALLSSHGKTNFKNVCRHDKSTTVGSAVAEVVGNEVTLYYLLNKSPCKGKYKKKVMKLS